ncbi:MULTISPECIES: hypothetical protein [Halorussus]|uniref:hypothetical protein n=1 Tax=Halorussus TaxID=1070314 RepID=UPI0020A14813|nr:hypothetical protein [Halorussus vallis]USZ78064.1 hypothetical protein NGM07_20595 [Halorussus vallis]
MTTKHAVNHLASLVGITLLTYAVWSMLLDPARGPLGGRTLALVAGIVLAATGGALLAWGTYRIYGYGRPTGEATPEPSDSGVP